jgi:hypothetical protein
MLKCAFRLAGKVVLIIAAWSDSGDGFGQFLVVLDGLLAFNILSILR